MTHLGPTTSGDGVPGGQVRVRVLDPVWVSICPLSKRFRLGWRSGTDISSRSGIVVGRTEPSLLFPMCIHPLLASSRPIVWETWSLEEGHFKIVDV